MNGFADFLRSLLPARGKAPTTAAEADAARVRIRERLTSVREELRTTKIERAEALALLDADQLARLDARIRELEDLDRDLPTAEAAMQRRWEQLRREEAAASAEELLKALAPLVGRVERACDTLGRAHGELRTAAATCCEAWSLVAVDRLPDADVDLEGRVDSVLRALPGNHSFRLPHRQRPVAPPTPRPSPVGEVRVEGMVRRGTLSSLTDR